MNRLLASAAFLLCISIIAECVDRAQLKYEDDQTFLEWCAEFCELQTEEYLARIYPTWKTNADYVEQQNSLGLSHTLSLNKFAHLVSEEAI